MARTKSWRPAPRPPRPARDERALQCAVQQRLPPRRTESLLRHTRGRAALRTGYINARRHDGAGRGIMTRHRTCMPRSTCTQCAVCKGRVGAGCGRTRGDLLGQVMCSKHGQAARRFAATRLLDLQPRLFVLLRARADLTFLRGPCLEPGLLAQLVMYPPRTAGEATVTLPFMMPYQYARRERHRRRAGNKQAASCGQCHAILVNGSRPWSGIDVCRPCHARTARQHDRAVKQFGILVSFVRNQGSWLLGLLHPNLRARVVRHLAALRATRSLDPDRFV